MKIAILASFYPAAVFPERDIKRYNLKMVHPMPWVRNLAEGLAGFGGNEVHVVTLCNDFGVDTTYEKGGVKYHFLKHRTNFLRGVTLDLYDKDIIHNFVIDGKFDIVHGQGFGRFGYFASSLKSPSVATLHLFVAPSRISLERFSLKGLHSAMSDWIIRRMMFKNMTRVISISKYLTHILDWCGYSGKVYEIENAVSKTFFDQDAGSCDGYGVFVGSIVERKSLLDVLKAMRNKGGVEIKVIFQTQNDAYLGKCMDFVRDNGLSGRVEFLGYLKEEEVIAVLRNCSFLVLPSKKEMAPMVISEAMAMGKAVIASNVDGIPYMVTHGKTGYLVKVGEIESLGAKMDLLSKDPWLSAQLGKRGREEAVKRWHPDIVSSKTMDVYGEILESVYV